MYCRKCGTQNDDNAFRCVQCGEIVQPIQQIPQEDIQHPYVPTYLVQAILVLFFCCMPFGIVSVVYAAQVRAKLNVGDYDGAVETSKKASAWCWLSFGLGLAANLFWFLLWFFMFLIVEAT